MKKEKGLMIMNLLIAIVCAYLTNFPNFFALGGYSHAVDGIVIARALIFIYGLYCLEKAFRYFLSECGKK